MQTVHVSVSMQTYVPLQLEQLQGSYRTEHFWNPRTLTLVVSNANFDFAKCLGTIVASIGANERRILEKAKKFLSLDSMIDAELRHLQSDVPKMIWDKETDFPPPSEADETAQPDAETLWKQREQFMSERAFQVPERDFGGSDGVWRPDSGYLEEDASGNSYVRPGGGLLDPRLGYEGPDSEGTDFAEGRLYGLDGVGASGIVGAPGYGAGRPAGGKAGAARLKLRKRRGKKPRGWSVVECWK